MRNANKQFLRQHRDAAGAAAKMSMERTRVQFKRSEVGLLQPLAQKQIFLFLKLTFSIFSLFRSVYRQERARKEIRSFGKLMRVDSKINRRTSSDNNQETQIKHKKNLNVK